MVEVVTSVTAINSVAVVSCNSSCCPNQDNIEQTRRQEIATDVLNEVTTMFKTKSKLKNQTPLSSKGGDNSATGESSSSSFDNSLTWSDVKINSIIGPGGFSMVYKVKVVSPTSPLYVDENDHHVDDENDSLSSTSNSSQPYYALKCLHTKIQTTKGDKAYRNAMYDLVVEGQLLSKLSHKNIIQIHGICNKFDEEENKYGYFLLLDVLHDTLSDRLDYWRNEQKKESVEAMKTNLVTSQHLSKTSVIRRLKKVAVGVAEGLQYLHENGVILRDLKPDNIGFDKAGNPKLFDFGFAREVATMKSKTEIAGSLRYMSPENALGEGRGNLPAGDVYSFGVLLFELCTLQKPFQGFSRNKETFTTAVVKAGWRHSVVSIPSPSLQKLITTCWDDNPKVRPTSKEVVKTLLQEVSSSPVGLSKSTSWMKSKKKLLIRSCGHLKSLRLKSVRSSFGSGSSSAASRNTKSTAGETAGTEGSSMSSSSNDTLLVGSGSGVAMVDSSNSSKKNAVWENIQSVVVGRNKYKNYDRRCQSNSSLHAINESSR